MKLFSSLLLLSLLLLGTSCERHPISQTIPGYEEKRALQQKAAEEKPLVPACCRSLSTSASEASKSEE